MHHDNRIWNRSKVKFRDYLRIGRTIQAISSVQQSHLERGAVKAGVSIFTISQFEKGEAKNIGFGTILSLLRSIGFLQEAEKLLPPLPMLPNQVKKMNERVRHER